jgi:transposase
VKTPSRPRTSTRDSITTTMPHATGDLSDFEKGQIAALIDEKYPISQIQKHVNRLRTTIESFVKRWQTRGSHHNQPATGRPPRLDARAKRHLAREARKDRRQPLSELRNTVAPQVSVSTVKRALREVGLKKWRAKKRPLLNARQAQE